MSAIQASHRAAARSWRRVIAIAFGPVLVASVAYGCTGSAAAVDLATSQATRAVGSPAEATVAASDITAFGLDLLQSAAYSRGNVVFSPTSIALALAMARAGAAGETASQMDAVMHSAALAGNGNGLNALDQALAGVSGPVQINGKELQLSLRIANAPFAQRGYPWHQAYLDTLASRFGAGLRLVDFSGGAGAVKLINGWVSDQTEQRIPTLLDDLSPDTRLVLVNAIYLKAPWADPFQVAATQNLPFDRLDGSQIDVPTMSSSEMRGGYAAGAGWKAADIPYAGGTLSMTIIVPDDLASFEKSLTTNPFTQIEAALRPHTVNLTLPRFKTETKADLNSTLSDLGMPSAFDPANADFSGMTSAERLYIWKVVHQATISVDEAGTEATAATAVVMAAASAPPLISLHADRPFIFAIRDTQTGAILFLGRIVDPSA